MAITINTVNQKPSELQSFYLGSVATDFDPYTTVKTEVIKPLFSPLINSAPVKIEKDGVEMSEDDVTNTLFTCCEDRINVEAEDTMKEIFGQTLAYYDKALTVQEVYSVQVAKKHQMLIPSERIIYRPDDVVDASKQFLAGTIGRDEFFANVAFYTRAKTFGYYFANNDAFSDFKAWFASEIQHVSSMLTPETTKLCNDLQSINLNHLTESFILRDDMSQNNEPYSFARVFIFYLMLYEKNIRSANQPEYIAGHMPFTFEDNFCPKTVVIMNVEKHAHAHPAEVKNEWDIIKSALAMKPKVLSLNKIKSLTAMARMAAKLSAGAASVKSDMLAKSAVIKFRKTPPTFIDLYSYIKKIYDHTTFVQRSENAVKSKKLTYQRPSRREPLNPDRQGKTTSTQYKPDLHIYLDCSGSISERDYQDAIKACIKLAKKMNVNFYFNSFSHIMSDTTKLKLAGKPLSEIYNTFRKIPKVAGGTDYEQIWHYINKSQKLRKQVSIVITDMEYTAPNHYVKHPDNLYYAPISTSSWSYLTKSAEGFARSMLGHVPNIRKKILM